MQSAPRRGDTSASTTSTPPRVVVTAIEPNQRPDSSLLGFASADIHLKSGVLSVERLRIVRQPGAAAWVSPPQESWRDRETNETRYRTLLKFPAAWKPIVDAAVLAAWSEFEATGALPDAQPARGGARR